MSRLHRDIRLINIWKKENKSISQNVELKDGFKTFLDLHHFHCKCILKGSWDDYSKKNMFLCSFGLLTVVLRHTGNTVNLSFNVFSQRLKQLSLNSEWWHTNQRLPVVLCRNKSSWLNWMKSQTVIWVIFFFLISIWQQLSVVTSQRCCSTRCQGR